jgi:dihydropteroate synthase
MAIRTAEKAGIDPEMIMVDPGIGFGKTREHNLEILKKLSCFKALRRPIMVGVSRKSFIGEITAKRAEERIFGTSAAVCASILNGADIVRVHDVAEMRDVALVADAIKGGV